MEGLKSVPSPREIDLAKANKKPVSYNYQRPPFLGLQQKDLDTARDHGIRKILQPSNQDQIPWGAGYAEAINSGKSMFKNEDQASVHVGSIEVNNKENKRISVQYVLYGVFDGHAGTDAALWAANTLHKHIHLNLDAIKSYLVQDETEVVTECDPGLGYMTDPIPKDDLVAGALEKAFVEMDEQIRNESQAYQIDGGCTAMVALFLQKKLYIANAGDCRAIILLEKFTKCQEMSMDFTPETDRIRLQSLAYLQPQLLGNYYGRLEFQRRLRKKDIGSKVLCRDRYTNGWMFHSVSEVDVVRVPMITGHGKRARLLATIGTTRGFGDHFLEAPGNVFVKPFLTPVPEVRVFNLEGVDLQPTDVVIMATDGLWECLSNDDVVDIVREAGDKVGDDELYSHLAHELVATSRGQFGPKGWKSKNNQIASGDDITCFVIPLHKYRNRPLSSSFGDLDPVLFGAPHPSAQNLP